MTGWNLPPGCTNADIDRAMGGDDPRCWFCEKETEELERVYYRHELRWVCAECEGRLEEPR